MAFNIEWQRFSLVIILSMLAFPAFSDNLNRIIDTDLTTNKFAIKSQKKINLLHDKTQSLLYKYRNITRQNETLYGYNQHLKNIVLSQEQEKLSLHKQLKEVAITRREIVPLILRMLQSLETFIQLDLPFLPEERKNRLGRLKKMMHQSDLTNAEKFRRILEAYQIENDYGKTIEAYKANLNMHNMQRSVDFLRIGRIALYYRWLDGTESGFWNQEKQQWEVLPPAYNMTIRNALRIAKKELAPDLITLPVLAAELIK